VTQTLNGAAAANAQLYGLAGLSAHLTDPGDRETYAALISYFHSLPPGDELLRLAQLLGFLSLLGERLPDALSGFLATLQEQTQTAGEYQAQLEKRLAQLPNEIAAGVDPGAIAKVMSEAFRQQLAAVGLEESARAIGASAAGIKKLSTEMPEYLKPLTAISAELKKVSNASAELRQYNVDLVAQVAEERWQWKLVFCVAILCVGFLFGIAFEKRSTGNSIVGIEERVIEMQQQPAASHPVAGNGAKVNR
jgi:hypothetical protein